MSDDERALHWTLDRRIPVALIVVMAAQIFTGGWFLAEQASKTATLERDAEISASRLQAIELRQGAVEAFGERIDERTSTLIEAMRRVEAAVSRIAPHYDAGGGK